MNLSLIVATAMASQVEQIECGNDNGYKVVIAKDITAALFLNGQEVAVLEFQKASGTYYAGVQTYTSTYAQYIINGYVITVVESLLVESLLTETDVTISHGGVAGYSVLATLSDCR